MTSIAAGLRSATCLPSKEWTDTPEGPQMQVLDDNPFPLGTPTAAQAPAITSRFSCDLLPYLLCRRTDSENLSQRLRK
jgi:hypothetical protein